MIRIRFTGGDDYCEVFDHGFMPGEWVGVRDLTPEQVAKLAANPTFEVQERADEPRHVFPGNGMVLEMPVRVPEAVAEAARAPKPKPRKARKPRADKGKARVAKPDLHAAP